MIEHLPPRLLAHITVDPDGCWVWDNIRADGYGRLGKKLAHRVIYERLVARLPKWSTEATSLELDHECRNRACCNPDHLELVTRRTNGLRGIGLPAQMLARTSCPQGHSLTSDNLVKSRLPHRQCRACHLEHQRRWRARRAQPA